MNTSLLQQLKIEHTPEGTFINGTKVDEIQRRGELPPVSQQVVALIAAVEKRCKRRSLVFYARDYKEFFVAERGALFALCHGYYDDARGQYFVRSYDIPETNRYTYHAMSGFGYAPKSKMVARIAGLIARVSNISMARAISIGLDIGAGVYKDPKAGLVSATWRAKHSFFNSLLYDADMGGECMRVLLAVDNNDATIQVKNSKLKSKLVEAKEKIAEITERLEVLGDVSPVQVFKFSSTSTLVMGVKNGTTSAWAEIPRVESLPSCIQSAIATVNTVGECTAGVSINKDATIMDSHYILYIPTKEAQELVSMMPIRECV